MTTLHSARLLLVPVSSEHEAELHRLHSDPFVVASIFNGVAPTRAQTQEKLATYLEAWSKDGFGFWMIYQTQGDQPVLMGRSGLRRFADTEDVELGHCFLESASGQGIAAEAGRRIAAHALRSLNLPKLVAIIDPSNKRAIKAAGKVGLQQVGERLHQGQLKYYFELTAETLPADEATEVRSASSKTNAV